MGNGANSRPTNPVHGAVQSSNQTMSPNNNIPDDTDFQTGYGFSAGYTANGMAPGQNVQSCGSRTHHLENHEFIQDRWQPQYNNISDVDHDSYYGVDEFIESTAAPPSQSNYRNQRNHRESHHQSALSQHRDTKKPRTQQQERSEVQRAEPTQQGSSSEEIVFEVFHAHTGVDYTIVNLDGMRFFLDSDSWTTGELQPFPEEWYQYGYIESDQRSETVSSNEVSVRDVQLDDNTLGPGWEDDRMGKLEHPVRGQMETYFEEIRLNVHCVFDSNSGMWLKLPLSWELHVPSVKAQIRVIQEATPDWDDEFEILALLRMCNYDPDEVTITYMNLLVEDTPWEGSVSRGHRSPHQAQQSNAEVESLRERIRQLEGLLQQKQTDLKDSCTANERLKNQLDSSQEINKKLQLKVTKLQREIQQLNSVPVQPRTSEVQSPKRPKIAQGTVRSIQSTVQSLSQMLLELRTSLTSGMAGIASLLEQAVSSLNKMKHKDQDHHVKLAELRALYHKEVLQRKLLYNKIQELRGNIRVFCRCRLDASVENALNFPSDQDISATLVTGQNKSFRFDKVFTPASSQEEVFNDTLPLITSCADGYNVCILAYGQTGAGKTHTMMGTEMDPGVNIRSIRELLRVCQERKNVDYSMSVSMVEVYNETLRDLLHDGGNSKQLNIQMTGKQLVITDVTEFRVTSADDIKNIMQKGDMNRSVGSTKMNTNSSRSHLLLLLSIRGTDHVTNAVTRGTLTLVDLAGSERISKTEATGQRLVEAAAINKSLSALGQVFAALRTNAMHVPYRNSKLTQLLQSSLGGDGKACLFINVSPASSNLSETVSTLQFGSAARQVQLGKATQNITHAPKRN